MCNGFCFDPLSALREELEWFGTCVPEPLLSQAPLRFNALMRMGFVCIELECVFAVDWKGRIYPGSYRGQVQG